LYRFILFSAAASDEITDILSSHVETSI